MMRERAAFFRPTAHRGLHDSAGGIVENSALAFAAAIEAGYGIECDVRPASDGTPVIFHDDTLDRLTDAHGDVSARAPSELTALRLNDRAGSRMMILSDGLQLVGGRVPLLIEIKSEWQPADPRFLAAIAAAVTAYDGPAAVMSFDPDYIAPFRDLAPDVPRGIVSGRYGDDDWPDAGLTIERRHRLRNCLDAGPAAPDFIAYEVAALDNPVIGFARDVANMPIFTWTVRSADDRAKAARHADVMIFEGFRPAL